VLLSILVRNVNSILRLGVAMSWSTPVLVVLIVILLLPFAQGSAAGTLSTAQAQLASHWVPGWGFRDSLNSSIPDYENFWTDNAGKITVAGVMANDTVDADRALGFVINHSADSAYYLPEVVVNSSILQPWAKSDNISLANRIDLLWGSNESQSKLEQLSMGDYYAGPWLDSFLGADKIWYDGAAHRANSSIVVVNHNGFVKKALFSFGGLSFYTYLNVTISVGYPYLNASLQVQPLDSTFGSSDYIYLQAFAPSSSCNLENATLYDNNGGIVQTVPFRNAIPVSTNGLVIAYSNRTSTLEEHSVAIKFDGTYTHDVEHYYNDTAFDGLSWVGLGYMVPEVTQGRLSLPVYASVYPIQHLDHRLLSDTVRYLLTNPKDVSVAPPVGFGFIAEGLALEANVHPNNSTLGSLAEGYWNFYYDRYSGTQDRTQYVRSISIFAVAGFELYGCSPKIEGFARTFVEEYQGASIEEYGWSAAALHSLYACSHSDADDLAYAQTLDSFVAGGPHFLGIKGPSVVPAWSFQFAEAASGLLIGKAPYDSPAVVWAMNAVLQSERNGTILVKPNGTDLANTETLPAYILATSLYEHSMLNATGFWIESLRNANVTGISFSSGRLTVEVSGKNGSIEIGSPGGVTAYPVSGQTTITLGLDSGLLLLLLVAFAALVSGVYFVLRLLSRR